MQFFPLVSGKTNGVHLSVKIKNVYKETMTHDVFMMV